MPIPLLVILGPTASGKTALSLKLAHERDGEIISADSRQLYKGMEVSTDTLPWDKQEGIPHHLLGITTPDKPLTLAEYKDLATQKIAEIHSRNKLPILVGGTGLYISAITEGYDVPRIPPDPKLRAKLEKHTPAYLYKKLQKLDPDTAKKIHPNNLRYVIRALEINLSGHGRKADTKQPSTYEVEMISIKWPREKLYERINHRVDQQIENGLVQEVKTLLAKGYDENLPAMSSIGVKEIIPYLKGNLNLKDCVETLKKNTRNYAKRQMTWFRRYDNVTASEAKLLKITIIKCR
ncbi:MAG: tRNA (adenosine(37)-N6)-dimethylallyltransferase MiaA [Candidatus Gracilibacteria bacterium]